MSRCEINTFFWLTYWSNHHSGGFDWLHSLYNNEFVCVCEIKNKKKSLIYNWGGYKQQFMVWLNHWCLQSCISQLAIKNSKAILWQCLVPKFSSQAVKKSKFFFHRNHKLGALDFTSLQHWAPFNFSLSTALNSDTIILLFYMLTLSVPSVQDQFSPYNYYPYTLKR